LVQAALAALVEVPQQVTTQPTVLILYLARLLLPVAVLVLAITQHQ
jgi:hypothetical protein